MMTYLYAPEHAIPKLGTVHRRILDLLSRDKATTRKEIIDIEDNFRGIFQALENGKWGYWCIERIYEDGSTKATHFRIDRRHFESQAMDALVRAERRVALRKDSLRQAYRERARVKRATEKYQQALNFLEEVKSAQQKPDA